MGSIIRRTVHACTVLVAGLPWSESAICHAQLQPPPLVYDGPHETTRPVQATQVWLNVADETGRARLRSMRALTGYYPKDSLLQLAAERAHAWVVQLERAGVSGIHLDPYGVVTVTAQQPALAAQHIATRLATPGMSLQDKAFALHMAVAAFTSADFPERLATAEQYLVQLDALGRDAAFWRMQARAGLIEAYFRLGRGADVARLGTQFFRLTEDVPFPWRKWVVYRRGSVEFLYGAVIDALGGQPDGHAQIGALNHYLLAQATAPPALVAQDSLFVWEGKFNRDLMEELIAVSTRVGMTGAPIAASYWVNRGATRDSQSVAVTDGRVRVIEVGSFTCGPCVAAVPALNRLQAKYPAIEVIFLTATTGVWGNRTVDVTTECDRLTEHFLDKLHARIPIGIAYTARDDTPEGLHPSRVTTDTWNADHYPQASKPTFYILDGQGRIRHVLLGYARDFEDHLSGIIGFLQREAASTPSSTPPRLTRGPA